MEELLPFERLKRDVIARKEASSDPSFGCIPEQRPVNQLIDYGIINLNKPSGPSSHQVSDYVQRILDISKSGHSGTLDPKVSGVLPVALARATRIVQALLNAGKEYMTLMHLHKPVSEEKTKEHFHAFLGKIKQLPPVRSAVKRQEREREIYYMNIMEIDGQEILFRVGCQAGTYIRKLVHDLGKSLGVGAHMAQLVRTKAGPFTDKDWHSLQDLKDAHEFWKEGDEREIRKVILPFERAVDHLPKIWVFDNVVNNLCHGSSLGVQGISKLHSGIAKNDSVAVMTLKDEIICLGKAMLSSDEILKAEKGLAMILDKVFMERGIYVT